VDPLAVPPPETLQGVDRWAATALAELAALAEVRRVGVALVEGAGRRLLFTASDRVGGSDLGWCQIDAYSPTPLNDVIANQKPLTAGLDDLDPRYAAFAAAQHGTGHAAIAVMPLTAETGVVGGFVLYYSRPQPFDGQQRTQLRDLSARLARTLQEARRLPDPPELTIAHRPAPGSLVVEHEVGPELAAVGEARKFLQRTLTEWSVDGQITADAVLCLSELVTNAIIHTGGGCRMQVELHDGVLTTRVHDGGRTITPQMSTPADRIRAHGHGLQLVEALSSRWGQTADPPSPSVWFALDVP
jgi:anti-sigma regulatory factor (Ser/Thr protein kinase)